MHVIYCLVDLGSMIERLSMIFKNAYSFEKDGVKVLLVPLKMVHVPKPFFGEGTNLLTKSGVEKALMEMVKALQLW